MLVVTTESIPGRHIAGVLGQVAGVTARTHNPFVEGVRDVTGPSTEREKLYPTLLRWREEAVEHMVAAARKRGANAVVGMRFDHRQITPAMVEICAYGTAVMIR